MKYPLMPELKIVWSQLYKSIDVSILVYFRIVFGILMFLEVIKYFTYYIVPDSISKYWIEPSFHFFYYGFDWIKPLSGDGMYIHFAILAILCVFITIGFKYRISTALFFVGFTYVFLLDQAYWSNYYYLIVLISFLMIFVPANGLCECFDHWARCELSREPLNG